MKETLQEEWTEVTDFGNGIIYARGNERKLVDPGFPDFFYSTVGKLLGWSAETNQSEGEE